MPVKPILRHQIEEAQRHTQSNMQAARWLGVSYTRYKQYAKLYGLFERHLNQKGVGIDKGYSHRPRSIPLTEILAGKHPDYSLAKLKNRLVARKKLVEACALCGFHERRITDHRTPLILTQIDGDRTNYHLNNLQLLCYNCMFLTTGSPNVVHRRAIAKSLNNPHSIQRGVDPQLTIADQYDVDPLDLHDIDTLLSQDERDDLLRTLHDDESL